MPTALEQLESHFGYTRFRGQQQQAIDTLNNGGHVLLIMPTGMGKSICYQIPSLMLPETIPGDDRPVLTVVLSPLIALMKDQVDGLQARGIDAAFINSSLRSDERNSRYQQVADGQFRLLYVTPERFRKADFLQVLQRRRVGLLAVDEAHCISDWGHDFRPDYSRVAEWRAEMGNPTTIALTATATPDCQRDIVRQLGLSEDEILRIHEGINRPNLSLAVQHTSDDKYDAIDEILSSAMKQGGSAIVYFTLIKTLERFSAELAKRQVHHVCYHGDLPRNHRRAIQDNFMSGETPLVLATNAFGMGVDKEDIRAVIHAELPGSMESYYQEIGRAGRDGVASVCVLLYDERDLMTQMEFIEWKNPDGTFYEDVYDLLTREQERVQAFGLEWMNKQLQCRSKHDHRLDTVISILDRHGVVKSAVPPGCFDVQRTLPDALRDTEALGVKKLRDQTKLYALVQYVKHVDAGESPMEFLHDYFGIPYPAT